MSEKKTLNEGPAVKVEYIANDHIGVISLNIPSKMNAMTFEIFAEFEKAFEGLLSDPEKDVRAIVLTSTSKHFTAGLDLNSAM
jgi:enoyl-CoA hydratase/carnithine racemase